MFITTFARLAKTNPIPFRAFLATTISLPSRETLC